jgi:uroporphyrinogen-III synthase
MRLLVTRPEPDATTLKNRLIEKGHVVTIEPLIMISHANVEMPDLDGAQALIATSRNGLRAIATLPEIEAARHLAVFVVGPGTAATAQALGFQQIIKGPATARELVPLIAEYAQVNGGPLIHLAGDVVNYDFASDLTRLGFFVAAPVVYTTVVSDRFASPVVASMRNGRFDGVLLLSPRTADVYCNLVRQHNLTEAARKVRYFCLSPAIKDRLAKLAPERIEVASAPNLQQLLALIPRDSA